MKTVLAHNTTSLMLHQGVIFVSVVAQIQCNISMSTPLPHPSAWCWSWFLPTSKDQRDKFSNCECDAQHTKAWRLRNTLYRRVHPSSENLRLASSFHPHRLAKRMQRWQQAKPQAEALHPKKPPNSHHHFASHLTDSHAKYMQVDMNSSIWGPRIFK